MTTLLVNGTVITFAVNATSACTLLCLLSVPFFFFAGYHDYQCCKVPVVPSLLPSLSGATHVHWLMCSHECAGSVSTCFEHYVLIIRRSELYFTASGIVTLCRWPSGAQVERGLYQSVHRTATYRCDDTRCCKIQFWPPDDEHTVLETCRGIQ